MIFVNTTKLPLLIFAALFMAFQLGRGSTLAEAIHQFAKDEPGPIDLGMYRVVDSTNVATVLSYQMRAIPDLKGALKSPNPLIVAQAAWCLDCLKAKEAAPEVWSACRRLADYPKPRTREQEYAVERTAVFLVHHAGVKSVNTLL